jgi:hypothetical protein
MLMMRAEKKKERMRRRGRHKRDNGKFRLQLEWNGFCIYLLSY